MHDIDILSLKPYEVSPRVMRLAEMQGHRCAVCDSIFKYDVPPIHPARPSLVKVAKNQPRSYKNTVAVCRRCAGVYGNFPSLMAFYEYFQDHGYPASTFDARNRPINEETLLAIKEALEQKGFGHLAVPTAFGKAPLSAVERIATSIIARGSQDTKEQKKQRRRERSAAWMTKGSRRRFLEAQNHRCCYCGHRVETEIAYHPRYMTWEHVLSIKDGGYSNMHNVAIACYVCNNLRATMNMTADDFSQWAKNNLDEIERIAQKRLAELINKIRTKGKVYYHYDAAKKRSLYDYC